MAAASTDEKAPAFSDRAGAPRQSRNSRLVGRSAQTRVNNLGSMWFLRIDNGAAKCCLGGVLAPFNPHWPLFDFSG